VRVKVDCSIIPEVSICILIPVSIKIEVSTYKLRRFDCWWSACWCIFGRSKELPQKQKSPGGFPQGF